MTEISFNTLVPWGYGIDMGCFREVSMRTMLFAVLLLAVLAGNALADHCSNVGTQLHVVALGSRPIGISEAKIVVVGEYLKIPKTGDEIYFATIGVKQPWSIFWVMPQLSYLGGWYSGQDGLAVACVTAATVGPIAATLDFKRLSSPGGHRTKMWYHTLDYRFGPEVGSSKEWTVGVHCQKVDVSERWGAHLGRQWSPHVKLEGRYYRTLYGDNGLQFFRVQLVVS